MLSRSSSLHWYHWLILSTSLVLTFSAWYVSSQQQQQNSKLRFDYQADQIIQLVEERMEMYEEALWFGVTSIHAQSEGINYLKWKTLSSALSIEERYPGINGIGVIHYIQPVQLEDYLAEQRVLRPYYRIHPKHQENEYWPITYIEPLAINKKAEGLDMAHEANRFTAAKKARDTQSAQITGPIVLVQDAKKTPGFLFYVPFYDPQKPAHTIEERQQSFIGLVYAPFIMENLMLGTLQNKNRLVNFKISDGNDLLYDEFHMGSEDFDESPLFETKLNLEMYGRIWQFEVQSSTLFRQQQLSQQPLIILIGGLIIDAMLLGLFLSLASANKKAIYLAGTMTHELRESESKLNATIDNMMNGLITIDHTGIIQSFNYAAEKMFGFNTSEVVGKEVSVLPRPNLLDSEGHAGHYLDVTNNELIGKQQEVIACKKNGNQFLIDLAINRSSSEGNNYYIAVVQDLSDKVKAEQLLKQSETRFKQSLNFANVGTWEWNIKTDEMFWSEKVPNIMGHDTDAIKCNRDNYLDAVHPDDVELVKTAIQRSINKKSNYDIQYRIVWSDKSIHWLQEKGAIIYNESDESSFMMGVISDITRLRIAQEKAEAANLAKSQFLSSMSHELRTPLNAILGFSQVIQMEYEKIHQHPSNNISAILRAGNHLLQLINDLLDLTKVETGEIVLSIEPVYVKTVIEECFQLSAPLAEQYHISLNVSCDSHGDSSLDSKSIAVIADRLRLKQVLLNLITNAIKYNTAKGQVTVTCQELEQDNKIRITVEDTGRGIDEKQQRKLFTAFERLGAENSAIEGSGIGLLLAKQLIEEMKGNIYFKSQLSIGSQFWIELPKAPTTKKLGKKDEIRVSPPHKLVKTVLYIEDNPSNLSVMETIFESCFPPWQLITAIEPISGLNMAKDQQPDLILLDINLPVMDGYAFYEKLQQSEVTRHIPVIAVSALAEEIDIEKGKNIGFVDYITKPVDIGLLTNSINRIFSGH